LVEKLEVRNMRVLYLSAWYPSEKDQMMGLFVKKHAEAVRAQGIDVKVLDYEPMPKGWRPDLIQLNVLSLKNALRTYFLHLWYGVPYVVVEHWSRYLPQNHTFPRGLEGAILRFVAKRASMILPVSENLMHAMQDCGIENEHWQVVHNVVDDFFYTKPAKPAQPVQPAQPIQLLHVSCFDEKSKNVKGILRAMEQLWKQRQDWHLTLVGTGVDYDEVRAYADTLDLPASQLTWTGELTPEQVCQTMQQSDVFVLFSNYENAPVVLSESLAVGYPIVSTRVGGIPEMIPPTCGKLVEVGDEKALVEELVEMMNHPENYSKATICKQGLPYSCEQVGKHLVGIYTQVIHHVD